MLPLLLRSPTAELAWSVGSGIQLLSEKGLEGRPLISQSDSSPLVYSGRGLLGSYNRYAPGEEA